MLASAYGAYKNARDIAWRVLIDFHITSLPVSVISICNRAGIQVIKNSDVNELERGEAAASLLDGARWYIIYDDAMPNGRCRFTVAHELGHIFQGHPLANGRYARTIDKSRPEVERQADIFASRLLAPACVLWGLGLHTPEEIVKACDISMQAARIRAGRMELLYSRKKFLTSPLERKVYEQFKPFIQSQTK